MKLIINFLYQLVLDPELMERVHMNAITPECTLDDGAGQHITTYL